MTATRPILLDITLSYRSLGAQPEGILRSEHCFAAAVLDRPDLDVQFCRYDRQTGELVEISRSDAAFITTFVRKVTRRRPRSLGKSLRDILAMVTSARELRYRLLRWDFGRHGRRILGRGVIRPSHIAPGTVLALAGMVFDTHDVATLIRLKQEAALSIYALCYDVLPIVHPEYFQNTEICKRFETQTRFLLQAADRIASISRSAGEDLEHFATANGLPVPDLATLILGFEIPRRRSSERPALPARLSARGFVLCVGNINIRKNHMLLYRVWRQLAEARGERLPPLVVAGRIGWKTEDVRALMATDPAVRDHIVLIHDTDDDALAWLYENCLFSVYPSFYEGWGLPVSESLAFGRHCLTSTSSSMPEAAAGLAATLDPRDDSAWIAEIEHLLDDRDALAAHEAEIKTRFQQRSWEDAGRELVEQILSTPPPGARSVAAPARNDSLVG